MPPEQSRLSRRSGDPRQARTSALASAADLRARALSGSLSKTSDWQRQVIQFDREGPGVVGFYLDTVQLLASLCPLVPAVQARNGKWERSDDPVLNVLASGYRSPLFEQHELVGLQVRAREGVGESWIVFSDEVGWHIVTVPNVQVTTGSERVVTWTDVFGIRRRTPAAKVYRSWVQDPWEPWLATSSVRRALPNVKRIHSAVRGQVRASDSRLVMNGMIAFDPGDDGGLRPFVSESDVSAGPSAQDKIISDYLSLAQKAFTDDQSVAANVPFPYIGKAAQFVDIGRGIDEWAMSMEDKGIEGFARDVNFPSQLLTTGPGTANHWNEWILQEVQQKMGLAPKLDPVCLDITTIYFRPAVRLLKNRVGSWDVDPNRVRLQPDYSFLTSKPDKSGRAIEAYRVGGITREEMVHELGFNDVLPLPAGISEYEHWELATGGKGFPFVEVGADGRVVLPEPPNFGGAGMGGLPVVADGDELPEDTGDGYDAGGVEGMPPEPPAQVAALPPLVADTDVAELNEWLDTTPPAPVEGVDSGLAEELSALVEELAAIDLALEAGLLAAANAAGAAATLEVAKAVIRAYPPRHPDREKLRAMEDPRDVFDEADRQYRDTVDVRLVAAAAIAVFVAQFIDLFDEAETRAIATLGATGLWKGQKLAISAGVDALVGGLVESVEGWVNRRDGFTAAGRPRRRRSLFSVGSSVVRAAMTVAGGAAVGVDGLPLRGLSGAPTPLEGGDWKGAIGAVTGHNWFAPFLPQGYGVLLRWEHGVTRTPEEPFEPHVLLDGKSFGSVASIPGGFHPLDHPWCSCVLFPYIVRTQHG